MFAFLFFSVHILSSCRDVSKIELIEDIDAYVNYIENVHADPYRLITRENFFGKAQEQKQKIRALENASISILDCFIYFQELSALIQDGHTRIHFEHGS